MSRITLPIIGAMAVAACAAELPPPRPQPVTPTHPVLPKGASMVGTSTFATIIHAPPDQAAVAAAPLRGQVAVHDARAEAEAKARRPEQGRLQMAFATVRNRLQQEEAGNFVGAMLRHEPDWAYVFFFKRDPAATLARYTREPRLIAELAVYSEADRARLIEPWSECWKAEGIPTVYGLDAVYPTMEVQLGIQRDEYRQLAAARGWGEPPAPIVLKFAHDPVRPRIDPKIAPLLRGFASEKNPTLMQLEALGTGKLVLEDGCLRLKGTSGPGQVAVFHFETGIGVDREGYLALIDRMTGKVSGRIGEMMAWGAPNAIPEHGMIGMEELRAACPGEVINIGNPESSAVFNARYGLERRPVNPPPPTPAKQR